MSPSSDHLETNCHFSEISRCQLSFSDSKSIYKQQSKTSYFWFWKLKSAFWMLDNEWLCIDPVIWDIVFDILLINLDYVIINSREWNINNKTLLKIFIHLLEFLKIHLQLVDDVSLFLNLLDHLVIVWWFLRARNFLQEPLDFLNFLLQLIVIVTWLNSLIIVT